MLEPRSVTFRPIQYLGSKWRMLDEVNEAVASVAPAGTRVVDLFAGTGVVTERLAQRWAVSSYDIQEYSRVLTSALTGPVEFDVRALLAAASSHLQRWLELPRVADLLAYEADVLSSDPEALASAIEAGSIAAGQFHAEHGATPELTELLSSLAQESRLPTLFKHYGGVYFSYRIALQLDAVLNAISQIENRSRDTAVAAALSTASDLVTSVGAHFAQPLRPRNSRGEIKLGPVRSASSVRERDALTLFGEWAAKYSSRPGTVHEVDVVRADFRDALASLPDDTSAVYADPPYTREHYSRFYHVLETIALADEPGLALAPGNSGRPSRGLYRVDRHQSPFSIVSKAPLAFRSMIATLADRGTSLVLSYSPIDGSSVKPRARVIGLEQLVEVVQGRFRSVEVLAVDGIRHSRLNRRDLSVPMPAGAEVLIVARDAY